MNAPFRTLRAAIALGVVGAALFLWPAPQRKAPGFADAAPTSAAAPVAVDAVRMAALFDLSTLPAPVEPVIAAPPPDPAAALKTYSYLGGAKAGEQGAALFKAGDATLLLKAGDQLAEFTLTDFSPATAVFHHNELTVELPIASR